MQQQRRMLFVLKSRWRFGVVVARRSSSTKLTYAPNPVSTGIIKMTVSGFDFRGDTLFRYITSHPGRLSLLPSLGR